MHIFFHAQLQQQIINGIYCGRPKWIWSITLHSLRAESFLCLYRQKISTQRWLVVTYILQEQHKNKVLEKFLVYIDTKVSIEQVVEFDYSFDP